MIRLFNIFLLLFFLFCSTGPGPFSGTAESGNAKISGILIDQNGNPIANCLVELIPENYNPVTDPQLPDSFKCLTDSCGSYLFKVSDTLYRYNIFVRDLNRNIGMLRKEIHPVFNNTLNFTDTVKPLGKIILATTDECGSDGGFGYVAGTTIYGKIEDNSNNLVLEYVPYGSIPEVYFVDTTENKIVKLVDENKIILDSSEITKGFMVEWKYKRQIYLITTVAGAYIVDTVYNYPVLVRLNSQNFDFTTAKSNGEDLRFIKNDSTELPYYIETWNKSSLSANIWVLLDTVYPNNSTQHFTILWGNENANSVSNSYAVFDTAKGFAGVWQFSGSNPFEDKTLNKNNGTNNGGKIITNGIIGDAVSFDGTGNDNFISIPASKTLEPYFYITIQAWVRLSTNANDYDAIFGYFNSIDSIESGYGLVYNNGKWRFMLVTSSMQFEDWVDNPGSDIMVGSWNLLTGVYDSQSIKFYLNGALVEEEYKSGLLDWEIQPKELLIGGINTLAGFNEFGGDIDELRIFYNRACCDCWVKLDYDIQRFNTPALVFK